MIIRFEELAELQRTGGIESATSGLVANLQSHGVTVIRSSDEMIQTDRPDIVHFHGVWSPSLALRWLHWRSLGVPCLISPHGMLEPWALAHKRLKKKVAWHFYQQLILNQAAVLHATSAREADNLKRLGLRPKIEIIPWGIPPVADETKPAISTVCRMALFVGRIHSVKGLPLLVQAWEKVRPAGWKIKIVGPDEAGHRAEVESFIQKAGLQNDFIFTGALSGKELQSAYNEASLFILPSHTENFGMAVGEALSHGLPVITTQGAPWELLETKKCGWWVPVSADGIAQALADATSRPADELRAMGTRGRQVVEERFAWDRIAKEMIACYEWVLGQRGEG